MIFPRRFDPIVSFIALDFFILFLFFLPLPSLAQDGGMNFTGASNCTLADFDTNLNFVNEAGGYYDIVVKTRNVSNHTCVFDGPEYGPSFVPDRVPSHEPFALCYGCEYGTPKKQPPASAPSVEPGQVVWQTFRWRTTPSSDGAPCLDPNWMSGPVLLVAPSLLKKICSEIDVGPFTLAPPSGSAQMTDQAADGGHALEFKLTSRKSAHYKGESFFLYVSGPQPDLQRSADGTCPTLYLRERSPNGQTRIDEVQPLAFNGCPQAVLGHEPGDWQRGFEVESGANSRWEGTGKHELQIFQLASSPHEPQLRFRFSNILQIQVADPAVIVREWGPHIKGIAADVTLDKATFRLGEDIPLHLAIEDFDAELPLYSWDPLWDPCLAISIEVQDERGHALSVDRRFPPSSICTGHGFGPRPVAKKTVIAMERNLRTEGWLPNHAGTFTVVIRWTPCFSANHEGSAADQPANLKPYAVAQAKSVIRIVSADVLAPN